MGPYQRALSIIADWRYLEHNSGGRSNAMGMGYRLLACYWREVVLASIVRIGREHVAAYAIAYLRECTPPEPKLGVAKS